MAMSTGRVVALIQAMGGGADPAVIEAKVQDWLDAHPEATTTVQDGSITEQKLATSIAQKLGLISSLSDEIDDIGSDVTDLKSAIRSGLAEVNKEITWNNGYIDSQGVVRSSSASGFAIVPMLPGDVVTVGTNNTNITIIGTTTKSSLNIGDSVRVEKKTSEKVQFETYSYICIYPINVVLCVRLSDYKLTFYREIIPQTVDDDLSTIKSELNVLYSNCNVVANGSAGQTGTTSGIANRIRTDVVPFAPGDVFVIENGTMQHAVAMWSNTVSSENMVRNDNSFSSNEEIIKCTSTGYIVIVFRKSNSESVSPSDFDGSIKKYPEALYALSGIGRYFKTTPITFENGKFYSVTYHTVSDDSGYKLAKIDVSPFRGGNISGQTSVAPNSQYGIAFVDNNDGFIVGYSSTNTGHYEFAYNVTVPQNATYFYLSCRKASESQWQDPVYPWENGLIRFANNIPNTQSVNNENVYTVLNNARHRKGNTDDLLTLLHFSDLHGDRNALGRIMKDAETYTGSVDGFICTGDMVPGEAEQITSWWDENVMTCIGNHDSAEYSGGVYDWTALSMADRDAYYIAPFESNWGIVHTSGASYYYKDYADQHVRLIVMDGMLYVDNGADATAQTAWLSNLLDDAITNSLHVIIAIHSPHGGSVAKPCTFTRVGQTDMPTLADCDTPQSVIDTVASKKQTGLNFIGYICGHTHQDNIWIADSSSKQLMYCVTCAAVSTQANQWKNSDQYRDEQHDAFNLVTIDTANTLVKIIRGGGADGDDHMRVRKAICFDYSTGEIVGEMN